MKRLALLLDAARGARRLRILTDGTRDGAGEAGHDRARLRPQSRPRADLHGRRRAEDPQARVRARTRSSSCRAARSSSACSTSTTSRSRASRAATSWPSAALVGKPLAALVAQPDVRRPRDLEGRTVGVSGLPSDPAFVKAIVTDDGGDSSTRQAGHDRLQRGLAAADQARRRRAGVLERGGRRAQAARARGARVPRRGLRRAAVPGGRAGHRAQDARAGARPDRRRAAGDRRRPATRRGRGRTRRCA